MRRRRPLTAEQEAIEATAAAWLAQRDAGFTAEDERAFAAWRAGDPRHEAAVERLDRAWGLLQELRDFRPEAHAHPDSDLLVPHRSRRASRWPALAAAASIAIGALVAWQVWPGAGAVDAPSDVQFYATTQSGYQQTTLADGSTFELNAGAELQVRYSARERQIKVLRGEAHFEVAKDPQRPFVVEAGRFTVRAVGTAFSVAHHPDSVAVLVTEGRVELDAPAEPTPRTSRNAPTLLAGQRTVLPVDTDWRVAPRIETLTPDRLRQELSWRGPRLTFSNTPLAEVVAQFNRHNDVQLSIADPELRSLPVGGSFRANNVEAFVRLLSSDREIRVERRTDGTIVVDKAR